ELQAGNRLRDPRAQVAEVELGIDWFRVETLGDHGHVLTNAGSVDRDAGGDRCAGRGASRARNGFADSRGGTDLSGMGREFVPPDDDEKRFGERLVDGRVG